MTARLVAIALLVAACGGSAPTPQIVYVTPLPATSTPTGVPTAQPQASPSVSFLSPTPAPAAAATATPRPATPTPVARQDFEVLEFGFSEVDDYVSFAVIGRNPNAATFVAEYVPIQVTLYDGDTILKTAEDYFNYVLPGDTAATSGFEEVDGTPTRMEVRTGSTDWFEIDFTPGQFVVEDVRTKADRFGGWTTTGTLTSEFQEQQENVRVEVVHRNGAGEIIGGDFTFLDFVDPGTTIGFEVNTTLDIKGVETTEVYWVVGA